MSVMVFVVMSAMGTAFAFVVMIVIMVIMAMIMVMRCVGVFIGQEIRVDVQYGVQVEAADIQQLLQVGFAEVDRCDRGARVDTHNACTQRDRKSTRLNSSH